MTKLFITVLFVFSIFSVSLAQDIDIDNEFDKLIESTVEESKFIPAEEAIRIDLHTIKRNINVLLDDNIAEVAKTLTIVNEEASGKKGFKWIPKLKDLSMRDRQEFSEGLKKVLEILPFYIRMIRFQKEIFIKHPELFEEFIKETKPPKYLVPIFRIMMTVEKQ